MPERDPLIPDYAGKEPEPGGAQSGAGGMTALVFALLAAPCLLFASWYLMFPEYGSGFAVMFGACAAIPLSLVSLVSALSSIRKANFLPTLAKYAVGILVCLWAVAFFSFAALKLL